MRRRWGDAGAEGAVFVGEDVHGHFLVLSGLEGRQSKSGFSNLLRTFGKYLTNIPHDMEVLFLEHFGGGRGGGGVGAWRRAFSPV